MGLCRIIIEADNENELVVKSNQVIEASYRLSVVEQRVVLSAIAKIPKMCEVSDDEIYTVSVQDLQALGYMKNSLQRLERSCKPPIRAFYQPRY